MENHSFSLQDMTARRITILARQLDDFVTALPDVVILAHRSPAKLAEVDALARYQDRLRRCVAFGQQLRPLPAYQIEYGQYGLFGTAAAVEILAHSEQAEAFRTTPSEKISAKTCSWALQFLQTWNFHCLIVEALALERKSKFWIHAELTLRNLCVLRTLAAASDVIEIFSDPEKRLQIEKWEHLNGDLGGNLSKAGIQKLARQVCTRLKKAMVALDSIPVESELHSSDERNGDLFCFATEKHTAPTTWNQYAYLSSCVLISLVRAYQAQLLNSDEIISLFNNSDVERLIRILNQEKRVDERILLFALYALSYLDSSIDKADQDQRLTILNNRSSSKRKHVPGSLRLGQDQSAWLAKKVVQTAKELLRSDILLIDLHNPYDVSIETFNYSDYFIIPVVPVLMYLLASYKPDWLFRLRALRLLKVWAHSVVMLSQGDLKPLLILPYQLGEYNGIVNLLFYREAAIRVAGILKKNSHRGWLFMIGSFLQDHWKYIAFVLIGGILMLTPYYLQSQSAEPTNIWQGFGLGVISSAVASILYRLGERFFTGR